LTAVLANYYKLVCYNCQTIEMMSNNFHNQPHAVQTNKSVHSLHAACTEANTDYQRHLSDVQTFRQWLRQTRDRLEESQSESVLKARLTQKELEKQVTLKHR